GPPDRRASRTTRDVGSRQGAGHHERSASRTANASASSHSRRSGRSRPSSSATRHELGTNWMGAAGELGRGQSRGAGGRARGPRACTADSLKRSFVGRYARPLSFRGPAGKANGSQPIRKSTSRNRPLSVGSETLVPCSSGTRASRHRAEARTHNRDELKRAGRRKVFTDISGANTEVGSELTPFRVERALERVVAVEQRRERRLHLSLELRLCVHVSVADRRLHGQAANLGDFALLPPGALKR